jgi:hypothetical protein
MAARLNGNTSKHKHVARHEEPAGLIRQRAFFVAKGGNVFVSMKDANAKGWKSKSAWERAGYRIREQRPVATVYRKTVRSRGLSFRNQEYIAHLGQDHYLLPACDEYVDGRYVLNSWDVYSPQQVVVRRSPARKNQAEVGLYRPEAYQLPATISEREAPFAHWLLSHLYYHPLMKFRRDRWEHFVPCGSRFLETIMGRQYKSILTKLMQAGEIQRDGSYWPGDQQVAGKCRGYRLAPHLRPATVTWRWQPVRSNTTPLCCVDPPMLLSK